MFECIDLLFEGIDDCMVVFVDDVLFFGCIVWVVLDVFVNFGCLCVVCFVVLVDCGYCELFICVDYVGKNLLMFFIEWVSVLLVEYDGCDEVWISCLVLVGG